MFPRSVGRFGIALLVSGALGTAAIAGEEAWRYVPAGHINSRDGLGDGGYDLVSYFLKGTAVEGNPEHSALHDGVTYWFASARNLAAFRAAPEKYLPQFGGFCAYAVAKNKKAETDPTAFTIADGRLYLNYDKGVNALFQQDLRGNLSDAARNWSYVISLPQAHAQP